MHPDGNLPFGMRPHLYAAGFGVFILAIAVAAVAGAVGSNAVSDTLIVLAGLLVLVGIAVAALGASRRR